MPPAHGIENPVVAKKDQKAKPKAQDKDQTTWLPIGIFACVMGVVFVSCWLAFGSRFGGQTQRKRGAKKNSLPSDEDDELDEDRPKKRDTLAADLAVAPPSTAVTVKAPYPPVVPSGTFSEKPAVPEVKAPDSHRRGTHVDPVADVPSIAVTQPPYFEARAVYALKINRFYRVYVLPEMLLFLDAGPESGDQYTRGITAAGAVTGGILGAAVGSAIGSAIDYAREDVRYARKRLLDTASTEELIELSAEGGVSFRAAPADLLCARIEPTSTWHTMQYFGNQYIGLLCFQHADQGDVTLELPTPNDMRIALAELPVVFGDQLEVNVALDRRSWQYVSK
jgi:hypothetical protein